VHNYICETIRNVYYNQIIKDEYVSSMCQV
jgi:hypothetical protein